MRVARWEVRVYDDRGFCFAVPRFLRRNAEREARQINSVETLAVPTAPYCRPLILRNPRAEAVRREP